MKDLLAAYIAVAIFTGMWFAIDCKRDEEYKIFVFSIFWPIFALILISKFITWILFFLIVEVVKMLKNDNNK